MNQQFTNLTYPKITGGSFTLHIGECTATLPHDATPQEIERAITLMHQWNDEMQRHRAALAYAARPWWRRLFSYRPFFN